MIGKTLAHYEVTDLLGKGGMGEVYRARDTKLGRDVAIKILPPESLTNPELRVRLEREARAMASLQHPNVGSIYGLEEIDGVQFLAMELVEGKDLTQHLAGRRLPANDALTITRQLAAGISAAHEKGIVHRDLKPANIMISPDGTVKILDFGLARIIHDSANPDDSSATVALDQTRAGVILGTAAYMSPEQARGADVDKRTDIWALGCVLYEMLTGKTCFKGHSTTDILADIVTREPDWSLLPATLPDTVRALLEKMLEKDARQRLGDAADIGLMVASTLARSGAAPSPARSNRVTLFSIASGLLFVILAVIAIVAITRPWSSQVEPDILLAGATFTRMTDVGGSESAPAISRDGNHIAFVSDRDGQDDIWMIPVGTGHAVNLTNGSVPGLVSLLRSVGFSHDGSEIWISGTKDQRLRRMPLVGGTPRPWLEPNAINVSWSPDGRRIVYQKDVPGDPLIVANHDGSDRREILTDRPGHHQHFPTWARDGWIYFARGHETTTQMALWRIRPDGTNSERLWTGTQVPEHPTPIDAKTLLFIARDAAGAGPWLWSFDLEKEVSRRVSYGLENYTSLAASEDGRRLVASVSNPRAGLWQVPITDELLTETAVQPYELPSVRALAPRFGPRDLFYLSSTGSGDGLWRLRDGTAREIWNGTDSPLRQPPAVSADGSSIAIILRRADRNVLHVLSSDGAELRALSDDVDIQGTVSWSPDGEWIAAGGWGSDNRNGLFKISTSEDRVERLVSGQAINPVWSPAGDLIVYSGQQVSAIMPVLGVRPDGTPVDLPASMETIIFGIHTRFVPGGRSLVYMKAGGTFSPDFWLLDLETMQERRLTRLDDVGTIRTFDITPDGSRIVFDRLRENADIVLIDLAGR